MKTQSNREKFVPPSELNDAWLEFTIPSLVEVSEVFIFTDDKHERSIKYKANVVDVLQCLKVVAAALSGGKITSQHIAPASQWVRFSMNEGFSIVDLLAHTHNEITEKGITLTSLARAMALAILGAEMLGKSKLPAYVTEQLLNSYWVYPHSDLDFKETVEIHLLALMRAADQLYVR